MTLRAVMVLTLSMLLTACASRPSVPVEKPVVRTIAVIGPAEPQSYDYQNVSRANLLTPLIPLIAWVLHEDNKAKARLLSERLRTMPVDLGGYFTRALVEALEKHDFKVELLDKIERPADDPDSIDYSKIKTQADALMQVRFSRVGVVSPFSSMELHPRVNARGWAYVFPEGDYFFDEDIYYGIDGTEGTRWSIAADPTLRFASIDAMLTNMDAVLLAFRTGAQAIAKLMAERVRGAVR